MKLELEEKLKYLQFKGLMSNWDIYLKEAERNKYSYTRLLEKIINEEYGFKKEKARKARLSKACIPEVFVLDTYPFNKQPQVNRRKITEIHDSMDYILKKQNLIFMGPTGAGKTGLATALLVHGINQGYSGRFITFPDLLYELNKSVADHSEKKLVTHFIKYDCLLIDELGYVEIDSNQAGLFFSLMRERHKKRTTIITSNLGFKEWDSFLKNKHLTAALIDRLTENCQVINMKDCTSMRNHGEK